MGLATTTFQGSGHALGVAIGQRFDAQIAASLADDQALSALLAGLHRRGTGQPSFERSLALHRLHYPVYVRELEGLAQGARVAFAHLFVRNLRGEFAGSAATGDDAQSSTCALLGTRHAVFAHNEDGPASERGRSYFVRVEPGDAVPFTVLCHPGLLPGTAFGFNDLGLCFAFNDLSPEAIPEGLGRRFLARSLLAACSIDEAVERLCVQPRGAGLNCTLGSRAQRRIVNVEVSAKAVHVQAVTGVHFHANHYCYQDVAQRVGESSRARQQRGETLLAQQVPGDARDVLRVLRDQAEREWPLWRDGTPPDALITWFSALFDLDRGTLRIYAGPCRQGEGGDAARAAPVAAAPIPGG